jgi:hypothetical protein
VRPLTTLEAQFLESLRQAIKGGKTQFKRVFLTQERPQGPALQLGLETSGSPQLVYYNVLIYGNRPVRYHLETTPGPEAERGRSFWNRILGPLNLVEAKSGLRNRRHHLFYEIAYPEKELKRLGER